MAFKSYRKEKWELCRQKYTYGMASTLADTADRIVLVGLRYSQCRVGALEGGGGGPQCRMSILRNGNVACLCRLFMAMSHVEFKK